MNDADIRPLLWDFLKEMFPEGYWIEEFNFGDSRADFVVLDGGLLHAFEIKGDNDTLTRLPKQVKSYDAVASRNYVVAGERWRATLPAHLPGHWGILLVDAGGITEMKSAQVNPKQKSRNIVLEMWTREFRIFLKKHKLTSQPSRTTKTKAASLAKTVDPAVVAEELVSAILSRGDGYRLAAFRDHERYVQIKSNYGKR